MTDEDRVRQLAYSIWEAEGRPEGQQQRHWDRALKIVAAEQAAGNEAELEDVNEPLDEAPILENGLPLEEDEMGIQENRLPLEDADGDPTLDEVPFRDDTLADQDLAIEDMPIEDAPADDVLADDVLDEDAPAEDALIEDVPVQDRGHPPQTPTPDDASGTMEPMPEESHTVARSSHPRSDSDPLASDSESDTSPTPAKKPRRASSSRKTNTADKADAKTTKATKTTKKAAPKANKPKTTK